MSALGGRVYVAGGFTKDGRVSDVVEAYDLNADRWTEFVRLPAPVHHAPLATFADRLWLVGGYDQDGRPLAATWSIAHSETQWRRGPDLKVARGALAVAVPGGAIHAIGGATGFGGAAQLTGQHEVLSSADGKWETSDPLPDPRDHLAAAGIGTDVYVVGGRKLSLETNTKRADVYDTIARAWRRAPDMPTARGGLAAAAWRGSLVVVGGEEPSRTIPSVEVFEPARDMWRVAPPLPTPRHGLGAAAPDDSVVVVVSGGPQPGLAVSDANEILERAA